MEEIAPVLIVGAGPTGLSLALFLKNLGVPLRIIEKDEDRSELSRAMALQPRTLEIFELAGIVDTFLEVGKKITGINMYNEGVVAAHISYSDANLFSTYDFPLIVPQNEIEEILTKKLKKLKVKVERGTELISFYSGEGNTSALLQDSSGDQEELRLSFIIGCDGAHSTVRHQSGFSFKGKEYPENFTLADVVAEFADSEENISVFPSPLGPVGIFPFPKEGKLRVVIGQSEKEPAATTLEALQKLLNERQIPLEIKTLLWISEFRINKRISSKWTRGNAIIAGDAAHIHSPMGGQGMNTGIQDAWNLAWKLKFMLYHGASRGLLKSYEKERQSVARSVLAISDRMTQMSLVKNRWLMRLRTFALQHIFSRSFFSQQLARRLSQLWINYPATLCTEKDYFQQGGPFTGTRAIDCPLTQATTQTTLFKEIDTKCFTCLIFLGLDQTPSRIHEAFALKEQLEKALGLELIKYLIISLDGHINKSVLKDEKGACHKLYGADGPRLTLLRPDAYVALQNDKFEAKPITGFMQELITS